VRLDPRDVGRAGALLDRHLLEGGLALGLVEALAQQPGVEVEPFGERLDQDVPVLALHVLAREEDVVGRAGIDEELAMAVEDGAARGRDFQAADALILGALGVILAADDL
jgi:hypothetical protein